MANHTDLKTVQNTMPDGQERRVLCVGNLEWREGTSDDSPGTIFGEAAVFNRDSENLGGFIEQIAPGAFANALGSSDVRGLVNHNPDNIIGRLKAKTLRLTETKTGLEYEDDLPDTQAGRDIAASVKRGDISGNSFAFTTKTDKWEMVEDGPDRRTIIEVKELFDVGPVTYPAYPDTTVGVRSLECALAKELNVNAHDETEEAGETRGDKSGELTPLEHKQAQRKTERLESDVERTHTRLVEAVATTNDDKTTTNKE